MTIRWLPMERIVKVAAALVFMLLVMTLYMVQAHGASAQEMTRLDIEFDKHWSVYLLAEVGCPVPIKTDVVSQPVLASDCKFPPTINYGEKMKARELAKKIFGLVEPK